MGLPAAALPNHLLRSFTAWSVTVRATFYIGHALNVAWIHYEGDDGNKWWWFSKEVNYLSETQQTSVIQLIKRGRFSWDFAHMRVYRIYWYYLYLWPRQSSRRFNRRSLLGISRAEILFSSSAELVEIQLKFSIGHFESKDTLSKLISAELARQPHWSSWRFNRRLVLDIPRAKIPFLSMHCKTVSMPIPNQL